MRWKTGSVAAMFLATNLDAPVLGLGAALALLVGVALGAFLRTLPETRAARDREVARDAFRQRFAGDAAGRDALGVAQAFADAAHEELGLGSVALYFHDPMDGGLRRVAQAGGGPAGEPAEGNATVVPGDPTNPVVLAFESGQPVSRGAVRAVPLMAGSHRLGVLTVFTGRPPRGRGSAVTPELDRLAGDLAHELEDARLAAVQRRTVAELQCLSAAKDDFIAITGHELRTPVTALKGFVGALERRARLSDVQLDAAVDGLARQVTRLNERVEDLLLAALIDAGRVAPNPGPIDVAAIVRVAIDRYRPVLDAASSSTPDFEFAVDVRADAATVWADPTLLARIVGNLVANAVRYSPAGGRVEIAARRRADRVRLEICDSGIGITPEDQACLFGKLQRLRADHSRGGLGLGLFLVQGVAEAMGAEVDVDSRPGQGSCFAITLPATAPTA